MNMKKIIAYILISGILLCSSLYSMPSEDVCWDAFVDCLIDAGIAGGITLITATPILGIVIGGTYASWCLTGYDWCKKYYKG